MIEWWILLLFLWCLYSLVTNVSAWFSLCGLLPPTLGLSQSLLVDATVDAELKWLDKLISLLYFNDITKATHQVTKATHITTCSHFFFILHELTPHDRLTLSVLTQINNKQDNYTKSYRIVHQLNISFHQLFFQVQYIWQIIFSHSFIKGIAEIISF